MNLQVDGRMYIKIGNINIKDGFLIIDKNPEAYNYEYGYFVYYTDIKIMFVDVEKHIRIYATKRKDISADHLFYYFDTDRNNIIWVPAETYEKKNELIEGDIEIIKKKPERTFYGRKTGRILYGIYCNERYTLVKKTSVVFGATQYKIIEEK